MKTKTLFGVGATVAVVALAASLVTAQGGGRGRGASGDPKIGQQGRPGGPGGRFGGGGFGAGLGALNLTEEQRPKIAELQRTAREQAAPVEEELRTAERALHKELFADARDAGKIADLTAKVASLQKQLGEMRARNTAALADVLTSEQRAAVREREGRGGGRGPGRMGDRGPGRMGGRFRFL